jgi:hypothetical protein
MIGKDCLEHYSAREKNLDCVQLNLPLTTSALAL